MIRMERGVTVKSFWMWWPLRERRVGVLPT
jgi:hypothetical protein